MQDVGIDQPVHLGQDDVGSAELGGDAREVVAALDGVGRVARGGCWLSGLRGWRAACARNDDLVAAMDDRLHGHAVCRQQVCKADAVFARDAGQGVAALDNVRLLRHDRRRAQRAQREQTE